MKRMTLDMCNEAQLYIGGSWLFQWICAGKGKMNLRWVNICLKNDRRTYLPVLAQTEEMWGQ